MTTMTITATATDRDGAVATASVDVEVGEATAPRGGRAFLARDAASTLLKSIPGYSGTTAVKEVVAAPKPAPAVPQASKSLTYVRFTGGYR